MSIVKAIWGSAYASRPENPGPEETAQEHDHNGEVPSRRPAFSFGGRGRGAAASNIDFDAAENQPSKLGKVCLRPAIAVCGEDSLKPRNPGLSTRDGGGRFLARLRGNVSVADRRDRRERPIKGIQVKFYLQSAG